MTGSHFYTRAARAGVCHPLHECRCGNCKDCSCMCSFRLPKFELNPNVVGFGGMYTGPVIKPDIWCPMHGQYNCDCSNNIQYTQPTENKMTQRKYLPTLSELIDRLSITQLKEVFISEHKEEYAQEIADIMHDIDLCLKVPQYDESGQLYAHSLQNSRIDAETIRAIIVLAQMNLHIWHNESNFRKGIKDGNNLELTHGLNGIRNTAKNKIQSIMGGRKDYKVDNVEAFKEWVPSGWEGDEE